MSEEQGAGIGDLFDALAGHVEASHLVGGAEAVLQGAHESQRRLPVALEVADDVDEVLEQPGAGDRSVFGDVADDDHRQVPFLGDADQGRRDLAHLRRMPCHSIAHRRRDGLHGVDDQQIGGHIVDVPEDRREVGLAREVELVVEGAGPLSAQAHLRRGFLAARVEHASAGPGRLRRHLEEQRRLADARLAREQDGSAGHDPAAEHAIELRHARRASGCVAGVDVGDRTRRSLRGRGDGGDRADDAGLLGGLDDGSPLLALAAPPDPLDRRPPALGAPVRGGLGGASGGHHRKATRTLRHRPPAVAASGSGCEHRRADDLLAERNRVGHECAGLGIAHDPLDG